MTLAFFAKSFGTDAVVELGMCSEGTSCEQTLDITINAGDWKEYRIPLTCYANIGVVMTKVTSALTIRADEGVDIGLSNIRLSDVENGKGSCDGK